MSCAYADDLEPLGTSATLDNALSSVHSGVAWPKMCGLETQPKQWWPYYIFCFDFYVQVSPPVLNSSTAYILC